MTNEIPDPGADRAKFRRTLTRVMLMQLVALLLLGWLQIAFSR